MSFEVDKHETITVRLLGSRKRLFLEAVEPFYEGSTSEQLRAFFNDVANKKWIKYTPSATSSFSTRRTCYNLNCRSLNFKEQDVDNQGNMTEGECRDCGTKWLITKKEKP